MAPTKARAGASRSSNKQRSSGSSSSSSVGPRAKNTNAKPANRDLRNKAPQPTSSKRARHVQQKKSSRRAYTEKELGVPQLNMITPQGVQKPKGKKKGKVFVDDQESMMTILAIVNADKEGQIESKMMKARQMEEIRQARQKELETRENEKKAKLEETKKSLRRGQKNEGKSTNAKAAGVSHRMAPNIPKKRVSFG